MNLANAVCGAVTTGVGMTLEKIYGGKDYSWTEIGVNSVVDGAMSFGLGKVIKWNGVTVGRNSYTAVYKTGLTKLRNETLSQIGAKVAAKGIGSIFTSGIVMDGYYGIKQCVYNTLREVF